MQHPSKNKKRVRVKQTRILLKDLIRLVSRKTGMTQAQTKEIVQQFLDEIHFALAGNKKVLIVGFGSLTARLVEGFTREGLPPVSTHRRVTFRASGTLKQSLNALSPQSKLK